MSQSVSFIVPVRNDAVRLDACLQSIRRNGPVEIIVADNGSTDNSVEVAERHGARVISDPRLRVSQLRNWAAAHATGDILAFVDADHEIVPKWTEAAREGFRSADVGAIGALCQPPSNGTWVQRAYGCLRGNARGRADVAWLGAGNLAVTRRAFTDLGGFDTALDTCEDVDLCARIRASGLRIVSDARLGNIHHGDPRTLAELFRGEMWRGRDNLRVSFRRPVSLASLPSAMVPVVDVLMLGAGLAGLVAALLAWDCGLLLVWAAILIIAAGACLRVIRALLRERTFPVGVAQVLLVACVYDIGRAMAIVARAPHRSNRPRTVATVP